RKGTAYGAYNFAIGIFQLPASLLMGALWWWLGAPFAFAFGAGLALAAAGALWLFVPARRAA
ncbi:MAG: MFS transporter, partial [Nitrospinota bacterium]